METKLKTEACSCIDRRREDLNNISQQIWKHPELKFEESFAHELLTTFLENEGFHVSKHTPLKTSFIARYGKPGGLKIGVLCEFDALPGIGHACGHNLIAEVGVGAALGIKAALMLHTGQNIEVIVFGTPAEEGGGGKILMIEKGVFDEVDFCMMSHPTPYEIPIPKWLAGIAFTIEFNGLASHAAAAPWEGRNALDAAVACYNNISMLRQQSKPTSRIHGVILDGGKAANIIPDRTQMRYNVRDVSEEEVYCLKEKIENCAAGAALATGCTVTIKDVGLFHAAVKTNETLINLYVNNARGLGVPFNDDVMVSKLVASTDMGNLSQIKPSIHPLFKIQTDGAIHTVCFEKSSGDLDSQIDTLNSAKSLAMTAIDVMCKPGLMADIKNDFMKN